MTDKKTAKRALIFFGSLILAGVGYYNYDHYNKKKCEWYLMPDLDKRDLVEPGFVSLCARNYIIDRQKCIYQSTLELAEQIYGKKIRFSDMKIDPKPFPRMVVSAPPCEAEK